MLFKPMISGKHHCNFLPQKINEEPLRRTISTSELDRISKNLNLMIKINEMERAECECCWMSEDCTPAYISSIKELYCGTWVCGLCSEVIKEHINRTPETPMKEVLDSHTAFCREFIATRLNPKLALAVAMRDIAKRCFQRRNSKDLPVAAKIARSTSCESRIDIQVQKLGQ